MESHLSAEDESSIERDTSSHVLTVPALRGRGWSLVTRIAFVYAFLEVVFWLGIRYLPNMLVVETFFFRVEQYLFPFFRQYILRAAPEPGFQHSYGYFLEGVLYHFLLPVVIGLVWFLIDRRRTRWPALLEWTRLACRYALAGMLLSYGGEKLLGYQGGWAFGPDNLTHTFGEIDGITAMFTWLSYSSIYAQFGGWAEAVAGLLMFSRRFTTLAAVLCLADMGMVWLMNQSYWDWWGTAAFSPLYFAPLALFLVAPHAARFARFFLEGGAGAAVAFDRIILPAWRYRASVALKVVMVPWLIFSHVICGNVEPAFARNITSPMAGLWRVDSFERDGVVIPPAYEHPERWNIVYISGVGGMVVRLVGDSVSTLPVARQADPADTAEHAFDLWRMARQDAWSAHFFMPDSGIIPFLVFGANGQSGGASKPDTLRYVRTANEMVLEGQYDGAHRRIRLRRIPNDSLPFFRTRWKPI